jgi:hypothetical protein
MKAIPDPPPRLSTFKRRGGVRNRGCSFRRPRSRSPDQRLRRGPDLLSCLVFNPCGPFSRHDISLSAFPLLPCVTVHPSLTLPYGLFLVSSSIYHPPRIPFPPCQPSQPATSILPPFLLRLHVYSPAASLASHRSPFVLAVVAPSFRSLTPLPVLASIPVLQAIQLFQVAA